MRKLKKIISACYAFSLVGVSITQSTSSLDLNPVNFNAIGEFNITKEKNLQNQTNIKIITAKDYNDMCNKIANYIKEQIAKKPNTVLGAATGSTYVGVYEKLVELYNKGKIDFSKVTSINLDEYVGLGADSPQSYKYYMNHNFFNHININPKNIHLPNGLAKNSEKECQRYKKLFEGFDGADLQLLGLGHNGHIAFNEPGDVFNLKTHCVKLDQSTINANKRFFKSESEVPRFAYTAGIEEIFKAKCIIMAVSDSKKAEILNKALTGPVTPKVPASILQLHKNVIVVGTKDALALLSDNKN